MQKELSRPLERTNNKTGMHVSEFLNSHKDTHQKKHAPGSDFSTESIIENTVSVMEERKKRRIESGELCLLKTGSGSFSGSSSPSNAPQTIASVSSIPPISSVPPIAKTTISEVKAYDDKIIESITARAHVLYASSHEEYIEFKNKLFDTFQRIETAPSPPTTVNEPMDDYNLGDTVPDY